MLWKHLLTIAENTCVKYCGMRSLLSASISCSLKMTQIHAVKTLLLFTDVHLCECRFLSWKHWDYIQRLFTMGSTLFKTSQNLSTVRDIEMLTTVLEKTLLFLWSVIWVTEGETIEISKTFYCAFVCWWWRCFVLIIVQCSWLALNEMIRCNNSFGLKCYLHTLLSTVR